MGGFRSLDLMTWGDSDSENPIMGRQSLSKAKKLTITEQINFNPNSSVYQTKEDSKLA